MNNEKQFWSAQEIADAIGAKLSQILYIIDVKENMDYIEIIANRRLFSLAQKKRIKEVLSQMKEEKHVDN